MQSVSFQDYNSKVIEGVTIPNFLGNFSDGGCTVVPTFISGPWSTFPDSLSSGNSRFDLILTSETIYNEENYGQLINVFDKCLSSDGVIWLAAKVHYFGVGGM